MISFDRCMVKTYKHIIEEVEINTSFVHSSFSFSKYEANI